MSDLGIVRGLELEGAGASRRDGQIASVRGVDHRPLEQSLFVQHGRQRIGVLAARAVGDPNPRERVRPQQRNDPRAERPKERGIVKEPAVSAGHREHETRECIGVVENLFLQPGDRLHVLRAQPLGNASFERCRRIVGEVLTAKAQDRLEQQVELQVTDRVAARDLDRLGGYRFSHTRSIETS